jgi:primosomal protein N' (replication factor Y) (superfamily II helicase)
MSSRLVDIALPVPVDTLFTYLVPDELEHAVTPGSRVLVPFGGKTMSGIVVGFSKERPHQTLKTVHDILDPVPMFSEELLDLCRWMSKYYIVPLGEVLRAAAPQGLSLESRRTVTLVADIDDELIRSLQTSSRRKAEILRSLRRIPRQTTAQLKKKIGSKNIHAALADLASEGMVRIEEEPPGQTIRPKRQRCVIIDPDQRESLKMRITQLTSRSPKQAALLSAMVTLDDSTSGPISVKELLRQTHASLSSLHGLMKLGGVHLIEQEVVRSEEYLPEEQTTTITPNIHQQQCLDQITGAIHTGVYRAFLLYGVTGSGKTQVYIEAIRAVLARGKTSIVLVPEISLTPQTVRRFKSHFGADVTVMHSRMSAGERYDAWRLAHTGKCHIVIGPRSAIFAPLKNIGLIIIDEEHEASYKQFDAAPRYNARDIAAVRALHSDAVVVFGSATPSAESYANALTGKYTLLELPERVDNAQLPKVRIIDMVEERKRAHHEWREELKREKKEQTEKKWIERKFVFGSISIPLQKAIEDRLRRKEGIILLQNRRGYSPIVECLECGHVEKCDHCAVTLTYHQTKKHLRCHYCGYVRPVPTECSECRNGDLSLQGIGTQRVEEELAELFPQAKILRMDLDTTTRKGSHARLLQKFGSGEADILLGTQMVAKGLDFPRVTLVGVISADTQMLLPDFRSAERTFQLLSQVAGRAGRSVLSGEVLIQTHQSNHFSLAHIVDHDFKAFYTEELHHREELHYPPFSRIVLIEFKGENETEVERHARTFVGIFRQTDGRCEILGPAPAALARIKNNFRYHVMIKEMKRGESGGVSLRSLLLNVIQRYGTLLPSKKVQMIVDVDPQGMM